MASPKVPDLLLLVAAALAAVPVLLPAGEDPALWRKPLSLAGLEPGAATAGAHVELKDEGSRWRLRVLDSSGLLRETTVAEPSTAEAREDIAWLAASLLKPASASSRTLPTAPGLDLPPPPPRVRQPTPRSPPVEAPALVERAPEPPEPIPEPPIPPFAVAVPEVEPVLPPTPAPIPLVRPEFAVGTGVGWRPGLAPGSVTWLRIGPRLADVLLVGLEAGFSTRVAITSLDADHAVTDGDALLGAWYVGRSSFPLRAGVGIGGAYRSFSVATFEEAGVVPLLGAELGVDLHVGNWLRIGPTAGLRYDLRAVEVAEEGGAMQTLEPYAFRAGLSVAIGTQSSDPSRSPQALSR